MASVPLFLNSLAFAVSRRDRYAHRHASLILEKDFFRLAEIDVLTDVWHIHVQCACSETCLTGIASRAFPGDRMKNYVLVLHVCYGCPVTRR